MAPEEEEKEQEERVFVAVPAEPRAARSTLAWALGHLCGGGGGATVVVVLTHVHVPPQMIPVSTLGGRFHASKLSWEQVSSFRTTEREKADRMLDDYVHQCSKVKVKCEKLVVENEDVVSGVVELIASRGVTKLVISAAADRQYSRKLDRPVSKTAAAIMQTADPSCKIWFVCKEQLICIRDIETENAPALLPNACREVLPVSADQEEDETKMELEFYDEVKEACRAAEDLMNRALKESGRRQKADEEVASSLQKAKEYEEMYLEEVRRRQELEAALDKANAEIMQLRQAISRNTALEESLEATIVTSILEKRIIVSGDGVKAGFATEHCLECAQVQAHVDYHGDGGAKEPEELVPSPFLGEDDSPVKLTAAAAFRL
ncbi:hypothetical protein BRADI_3g32787v3 [Brachypodium distachyon]|uniref:RING-type E3 ubiquitin transferase n=1 Tax=Brachypodium distachyon TaxID=15368 RepID=A0A2K2D0Q4_BRADI|nr:hypothetical protein BRADI_3g32787v3 [Brachypodium distachyon]